MGRSPGAMQGGGQNQQMNQNGGLPDGVSGPTGSPGMTTGPMFSGPAPAIAPVANDKSAEHYQGLVAGGGQPLTQGVDWLMQQQNPRMTPNMIQGMQQSGNPLTTDQITQLAQKGDPWAQSQVAGRIAPLPGTVSGPNGTQQMTSGKR